MKDYYLILGLDPICTTDEIKKAYRQMSLKFHPDKNQGDKYFEERFKDISEAYEVLSKHESRKEYDYQRLNHYKRSGEQTKSNDSFKTREEELIKKESNLDRREKELNIKEREFLTANNTKNVILIVLIIATIVFSSLVYFKSQSYVEGIFVDKITLIETELSESKNRNRILSAENESLKHEIEVLQSKLKNSLAMLESASKADKVIKDNEKEVVRIIKKETQVEKNEIHLPNRVVVKNSGEIELLNLIWYEEYVLTENMTLKSLSVYNKTHRAITSVKVSFEVKNSKGKPINSGEFTLYFLEEQKAIGPNKAVEYELNENLVKKPSDILTMTILDYTTKD